MRDLNPYQAPQTATGEESSFQSFQVAALPCVLLAVAMTAIQTLVILGLVLSGVPLGSRGAYTALVTGSCGAFSAVWMTLCAWYFKVYVCEKGLKCFDFWGRYLFVNWSEITEAAPVNVAGMRYLRLYGVYLPRPIWLPLFLARRREFWDYVRDHAPQSPLLEHAEA